MSGLDFTLSEEQAMVVETARRLLRTLEPRRDQHLRMIYEEGVWGSMEQKTCLRA